MCARVISDTQGIVQAPLAMYHHFSGIAGDYRDLRKTDSEPIDLIANKLQKLPHIDAADIGCGAGRYDLLLFRYLGEKLSLTCLDANAEMLKSLNSYLKRHSIYNFESMCSMAEDLPFPDKALDCVCTFNAVHHFNLRNFLDESARIIKDEGYLFIYTRLREQNKRNIWGQYFPRFHRKENRLYTMDTMKQMIEATSNLELESIVSFTYNRMSDIDQLLTRARSHHYSTFSLYQPDELARAIDKFTSKISNSFENVQQIRWFDENVLFVVRKQG